MPNRLSVPIALFVAHLSIIGTVLASLLTGLRIAADQPDKLWAVWLSAWLPQGEMYSLHVWSGSALLGVVGGYAIHLWLSQGYHRLLWLQGKGLEPVNLSRMVIWAGLLLLALSIGSGLLLYFGFWPAYRLQVAQVHYAIAWSYVFYLLLHVGSLLWAGGWRRLLTIFVPQWRKPLRVALAALVVLAFASVWQFAIPDTQLRVASIAQPEIDLDGEAREQAWSKAEPQIVSTYQGANQAVNVPVEVRALRDRDNLYLLLSWPDPTRSLKHLPLRKTAEGWQVVQTDAVNANEDNYYEDKLAVMWSRSDQLAGAGSTHLGDHPLQGQPAPAGGRGLHYTTNGQLLDVWHWKAVRTGLSLGQADDNYFSHALPSRSEYKRYTGGYRKDLDCEHLLRWDGQDWRLRPDCGGYVMNWIELKEGLIQPRRLPADVRQLRALGQIDLNPQVSDTGRWWMDWQDTVPYDSDQDHLPLGAVMPSVLSLGPFSKGRGGVDAGARWINGRWTLELKRALKTDSPEDLSLEDGLYLWVAVFDHSQTRHSYHLRPLRLHLPDMQSSKSKRAG